MLRPPRPSYKGKNPETQKGQFFGMILTCPACATRFFVENEAFGPAKRKVRCSRCRHVWLQEPLSEDWEPPAPPSAQPAPKPEADPAPAPPPPPRPEVVAPPPPPPPEAGGLRPDSMPLSRRDDDPIPAPPRITGFDDDDDDLILTEDRPPLHPPLDEPPSDADDDPDAVLRRRRERLAQAGVHRAPTPPPRPRRSLAWMGWLLLLGVLGALIGGGYEKRAELIAFYPPLAVLYEQLGIPVEASEWLGLELHNLRSATVLDGSQTKIAVTGEVVNVGGDERGVPAIRVSMRGGNGQELAAYTVTLEQTRIAAEDKLAFDIKLPAPNEEVTDLEVAFADPRQQ